MYAPHPTAYAVKSESDADPTHGASPCCGKADLLDRRSVSELFGGSKPINPSTLYRGIHAGRYPRPIHVGGSSRWLRDECEAVLRSMMEARS